MDLITMIISPVIVFRIMARECAFCPAQVKAVIIFGVQPG